jgi:hypothetical protein
LLPDDPRHHPQFGNDIARVEVKLPVGQLVPKLADLFPAAPRANLNCIDWSAIGVHQIDQCL